ncbi:MAG TPA: hypothetical protein VFO34_06455 [Candidatus Acidoferrales bacterium]|nr:hypothetical protein [Candidatus Acidoferrales bacterium]
MIRKMSFLVLSLLLIPAARAQSLDEVIAKYVIAHGGTEKMGAIQTRRMSGELDVSSLHIKIVQENKRPDKVREEDSLQGFTQVQAYNGKTGWQVDPTQGRKQAQLMSADDSKNLVVDADMDGPLVNYKQKGHTAELVGHDPVEGTDCFKIKLTLKNGDIRYYYLDADSFLEIKLETQTSIRGSIQESETYFGDYEKVDGLYYPFAIETGQKGDPNRVRINIDKVEHNVPIDDAHFAVPTTTAAPAKTPGSPN